MVTHARAATRPSQAPRPKRPLFPPSLLGYGALYAFGYTVWETSALSTRAVVGGTYDVSWLVSAVIVPLALIAIVFWARDAHCTPGRPWYVAAPLLGVVGSVLSVVYQHVVSPMFALVLAAASGACTATASALFIVLWGLAFSHFSIGVLETAIPLSFVVPLVCSLVVPAMSQIPALVVALLLVALCTFALGNVRRQLSMGSIAPELLEEGSPALTTPQDTPLSIARILAYGVVAWALCSFAPCLAANGDSNGPAAGIDVVSATGYCIAIAYACFIIRYAIRVDFLALASMTLPPFVLSVALYAFPGQAAQTVASVLNVAMGACFEIILLIYFVRAAQRQDGNRAFLLALGSCAGYFGVLVGQLGAVFFAREVGAAANKPLWCLAVICVYAFALALVPQRQPYEPESTPHPAARTPQKAAGTPNPALDTAKAPSSTQPPATATQNPEPGKPTQSATTPISQQPPTPEVARPDAIDQVCATLAAEHALSSREAQICSYLARGRSQTYIRDALFLSKNTVATHVRHLYTKLGVHSKQELIDLVEKHL